jgi:hypothetical protein
MKFGRYPTVLRIPWPRLHDVVVRCASNTVAFGSEYCISLYHGTPITVHGVTEEPPEHVYEEKKLWTADIPKPKRFRRKKCSLNGISFLRTVKNGKLTISKASSYHIFKGIEAKDVKEKPLKELIPKQYREFLPRFS